MGWECDAMHMGGICMPAGSPHACHRAEELPPERMRVIFSGRVLKDDAILRDNNIGDKKMVQIFPKPKA